MTKTVEPIGKILVPIDFSDCSINALNFAKRVAAGSDAALALLYVDDDPILMQPSTDQSFRDEHENKMAMKFVELLTTEERERFKVEMAVRCGTASHEIEKYAAEKGIDLIVIGNIGRSKISKVLLGSTTSHIVANAPCPVLTVKPSE
ncbi:MAG: universal stress protein [Planctomycetota bacterium]